MSNFWTAATTVFVHLLQNVASNNFFALDLDLSSGHCLIIPQEKIWPFSFQDNPDEPRYAGIPDHHKRACNALGMVPAILQQDAESLAILSWKGIRK